MTYLELKKLSNEQLDEREAMVLSWQVTYMYAFEGVQDRIELFAIKDERASRQAVQ